MQKTKSRKTIAAVVAIMAIITAVAVTVSVFAKSSGPWVIAFGPNTPTPAPTVVQGPLIAFSYDDDGNFVVERFGENAPLFTQNAYSAFRWNLPTRFVGPADSGMGATVWEIDVAYPTTLLFWREFMSRSAADALWDNPALHEINDVTRGHLDMLMLSDQFMQFVEHIGEAGVLAFFERDTHDILYAILGEALEDFLEEAADLKRVLEQGWTGIADADVSRHWAALTRRMDAHRAQFEAHAAALIAH